MKQIKIQPEHVSVLKAFFAYADGYSQGIVDASEKYKSALADILAAQPIPQSPTTPASGEHGPEPEQEPDNAISQPAHSPE